VFGGEPGPPRRPLLPCSYSQRNQVIAVLKTVVGSAQTGRDRWNGFGFRRTPRPRPFQQVCNPA